MGMSKLVPIFCLNSKSFKVPNNKTFIMRKIRSLKTILLMIMISGNVAFAQDKADTKYWMIFKDKGEFKPDDIISQGSDAYVTGLNLLSERAIKRRLKVRTEEKLIDYQDLPVNKKYIEQIEKIGIDIIAISRWLNGVSAYLNQKQLRELKGLDFIEKFKVVGYLQTQGSVLMPHAGEDEYRNLIFARNYSIDSIKHRLNYGKSLKQMQVVNVPKLHDMFITGRGVLIANLDDGFDWRNHEALRDLNIIAEYDFINKDSSTFQQDNQKYPDLYDQGGHGTATLSSHSGFMPGKLISPAFDSEIILAKTEYVSSETPMEEDFWLEAAEWAEAMGADIITSSLIYKVYDPPFGGNSYSYEDFNGETAITSLAATRSAQLGIVVLNAMGNYFQTAIPSLGSAADADSILSVGAITLSGDIATFSSNGPTSDGRIKPEVVAPGVMVYVAQMDKKSNNKYSYSNGTSFSTPITAGVTALILSAHPYLTPMQVREALMNTASNSSNPNNIFGWGIVNGYEAALYFGMIWSNVPQFSIVGSELNISTYLASKNLIRDNSVEFHYSVNDGISFETVTMRLSDLKFDSNNSGKYIATIPFKSGQIIKYYFTAEETGGTKSIYPHFAPEETMEFQAD